jgi:hypothetical protein
MATIATAIAIPTQSLNLSFIALATWAQARCGDVIEITSHPGAGAIRAGQAASTSFRR